MIVRQLKVGPMENFVYLVVDEGSKEALIVDSGWETSPIARAAAKEGAQVKYVVATHEHFDHVSTLDEIAGKVGAEVAAYKGSPVRCDLRLDDGSELELGAKKVKVLHTPGHTADSICLYDGREVFTGDTLFVGTIGRFDPPAAEEIFRSIDSIIMRLPGETVMYPGHDYGEVPSRTLQEEKGANPYLKGKGVGEFLALFS